MEKKKKWRKLTQYIVLFVLFALLIWDVIVAITTEANDTISENMSDYGVYPVLPAAWGGLGAHFWFHEIRMAPRVYGMIYCIAILLGLVLWSILAKYNIGPSWIRVSHLWISKHPMMVFYAATIFGGVFWGLGPSQKII